MRVHLKLESFEYCAFIMLITKLVANDYVTEQFVRYASERTHPYTICCEM